MKVEQLRLEHYRNLEPGVLRPCEGVNVIYGSNAQGKTNLLEAVWLFTGGRSFRGSKDGELIAFDEERAELTMDFFAQERQQQAKVTIANGKRAAVLNGVPKASASALIGSFCAVVFAPVHLSLIKEGPAERRRFLDAAICQVKPAYAGLISRYSHTLSQRNALLKDVSYHAELLDTLEIWEEKLARYGGSIAGERLRYLSGLSKEAQEVYRGISEGKERFSARYRSTFFEEGGDARQLAGQLRQKLFASRREDLAMGFTGCGPHRDDVEITIDGKSARAFGSQGQQRSCVLALKLAEASMLRRSLGEKPVVLLDDVMSELDVSRQDYLLNHIGGWQVFITCCEPDAILRMASGAAFEIDKGRFQKEAPGPVP